MGGGQSTQVSKFHSPDDIVDKENRSNSAPIHRNTDSDDTNIAFKCPQCGEKYNVPRILYNKHSVCKKCFDKIKNKDAAKKKPRLSLMNDAPPIDATLNQSPSLPDLKINLGVTKFQHIIDEKRKHEKKEKKVMVTNPVISRRDVLDKINSTVDTEYIETEESFIEDDTSETNITRLSLIERRRALIPAFFKCLSQGTFLLEGYLKLVDKPYRISIIQGNIWCTQDSYITAWTPDFKPVEWVELGALRLKHDLMTEIQAVAELKSGRIAVVCGSGLHLLTKRGKYDGRITEGVFTDVATKETTLYAVMFGLITKARVQVYDEAMPWVVLKNIVLPTDGFNTIHISDTTIYVCNATHGGLYMITTSGEVITKCAHKGVYGRVGQFHEPRICQGARDGSLLVADRENESLQVQTQNGEWGMVNLERRVKAPGSALYYKKHLYVLQTDPPFKIYRFM